MYPDSTNIREQVTNLVVNQLKYPLHIVSIDEDQSFKEILFEKTKTLTAREELVRRRKYSKVAFILTLESILISTRLKLLFDIAIEQKCTKVITGDNCTKLAAQILSDMAQGKGAHVALECVS